MRRSALIVCVLALIPIFFHAQEKQWEATLSVSAPQVLVGEPACLRLTVKNVSNTPLTLPVPISWWHPRYISIRFIERPPLEGREDYNNPVTAIQETLVSYSKKSYAPGEEVVLERSVLNGNPGKCVVQYAYDSRNLHESFNMKTGQTEANSDVWRGLIESNKVSWDVIEPAGINLEAMKAYQAAMPSAVRGLIIQQWKEQLFARFPASTYAGYALLKLGPASTMWGLARQTPEQREIELGIPKGAPREDQEKYRAKLMAANEDFVAKAERFLQIHPNFAQADLLRKELANALFLLDRPQQALEYVRAINAKGGPLAEEAAKTLQACGENGAASPSPNP